MIKITTVHVNEQAVTIKIDGRITGCCSAVLETLFSHHISVKEKNVLLDLRGVTYIDDQGIIILKKLQRYRLAITHSTFFIKSLLNHTQEELENIDNDCCTK